MQVPKDWAPLFVVSLLSSDSFEWAKNFLNSGVWRALLSCACLSSTMAFALPDTCPQDANIVCSALEIQENARFTEHINESPMEDSSPATDKNEHVTTGVPASRTPMVVPLVDTAVRRSPRIKSLNEGSKPLTSLPKTAWLALLHHQKFLQK